MEIEEIINNFIGATSEKQIELLEELGNNIDEYGDLLPDKENFKE